MLHAVGTATIVPSEVVTQDTTSGGKLKSPAITLCVNFDFVRCSSSKERISVNSARVVSGGRHMVQMLRSKVGCSVVTISHAPFDFEYLSILQEGMLGDVRVKHPPCLVFLPTEVSLSHLRIVNYGKKHRISSSL